MSFELATDEIVCRRCGVPKLSGEFYATHNGRRRKTCKTCVLKRMAMLAALKPKNEPGYNPIRDRQMHVEDGERFYGKGMQPIDLTPCRRCGLRGHLPGDPDRCVANPEHRSTGMGSQGWL